MSCCPNCGQVLPRDPVDEMLERLREACQVRGLFVTWDDHVTERIAAELLGREMGTLRNWRSQHRPLKFRKLNGRIEYPLSELARMLVNAENIAD